jgi:hypothetical protein
MITRFTRITATGVTAASLAFGIMTASGVSAKTPDALTINPNTLETKAPADFTPGEQVGLWYNLSDGSAVNFETTTALADGSLDFTIATADFTAIPSNAVNLVAEGWQSDTQAIYTFSAPAAMVPAALGIDMTTFEAKAPANFLAGEEVGLWYNLPDGTAVNYGVTTALADGSLDWTLSQTDFQAIPSDAVNFVAQGFASNHQAIYTFTH